MCHKILLFAIKHLVLVAFALTNPTNVSAREPAQFQACGVFGALESTEAPICRGNLIGGSQTDVNKCPQAFNRLEGLEFDDDLHLRWYARFWTGKCKNFRFLDFCVEDEGGWYDLVDVMSARVAPHERVRARAELWAVGRMIGYEWSERNQERKISTDDLRDWYPKFRADLDTWRAMTHLCSEAKRKLGD